MRLDNDVKAEIRFFIYYLINGTLDFDLLNNKLKTNYRQYLAKHADLFFLTCCVFINNQSKNGSDKGIDKRCAEFICQYIEPDRFNSIEEFQGWESDAKMEGLSLANSFKDFAFRIAHEKLDTKLFTSPYYSDFIIRCGPSFVEQGFTIWANNIEIENDVVINQEYAIARATQYFKTWFDQSYSPIPDFEEWELELAM